MLRFQLRVADLPTPTEAAVVDRDRLEGRAAELRSVLDTLPFAVAIKDANGVFLYANAAASAGYGLPPESLVARGEREILPTGNDAEAIVALDREVIESGRSLTVPGQRFLTHEGRPMILHIVREPIRFDDLPAVLVTAMDVTEASAMRAASRQDDLRFAEAQRLGSLGLMAGGIAHDFNNVLIGVLANAEMAVKALPTGGAALPFIERVVTAANRLAGLTRQMLAYTGQGHVEVVAIDPSALVRESLDLIRPTLSPRIRLVAELPSDLPSVSGDGAQLTQIVVNLVVNAAEDDGPGMDEATRNQIFDPFFTTKAKSGRGLGLASVMGIVRAHQGALRVDSSPGRGTRMRVWLPLAAERQRAKPRPAPKPPAAPAGGSVLVIDDHPLVRETTRAVLEMRGFSVRVAADGAEGVEIAKTAGEVDVILLDMTMPGPPIAEVHRALRTVLPSAPILLTSGYAEPAVLSDLLTKPATAFIAKPYTGDELVRKLEELSWSQSRPT